jgi:hypothetical protein
VKAHGKRDLVSVAKVRAERRPTYLGAFDEFGSVQELRRVSPKRAIVAVGVEKPAHFRDEG